MILDIPSYVPDIAKIWAFCTDRTMWCVLEHIDSRVELREYRLKYLRGQLGNEFGLKDLSRFIEKEYK